MGKTDVVVRTAADLERKYNLAAFQALKKNVEITAQGMQKIENELNSMLNALIINLKDVLDSQSEISLWFYSGKPTTSNEPYKSWSNPNDHIGDLYYDINTGYVYQYNGVWEVNTSPDLVEAMAITNAETDTSTDHERKVFFDTPTIPYSNGDWWVKEDGSLFICQISKTSGTYEKDDFIDSSKYTESIATKIGEEIKVLKGTITMITENYAKFTDLATGGSTVISGDNITTGNIQSQNYINNVSGTKISLEDGTIDAKNFKVDSSGNVTCNSAILNNAIIGSLDDGESNCKLILNNSLDENIKSEYFSNVIRLKDETRDATLEIINNISTPRICLYTGERNTVEKSETNVTAFSILTPVLTQTSLAEQKKNFEKFENALSIVEGIDLYKYNLKTESDGHKKHIGFVIGEDYNYSSEITTVDENGKEIGVDNYSMTSLCLQAIKEQQEMIEQLKQEIQILKGGNE